MKVYVHLAEGFEEIEAITVVDVLRRAKIDVEMISITGSQEVKGAHNISIKADKIFEDTDYDVGSMIVLPGGMPGTTNLSKHKGLVDKILSYASSGKWVAAICAAPMILGELGILNSKAATCFPGFEKHLKGAHTSTDLVVVSDKIITSKGPSTALLFSIKIIELLLGKDVSYSIKQKVIF